MWSFIEAERERLEPSTFSAHKAAAVFLEQLAGDARSRDLHPGFMLPDRFEQFDSETWPKNDPVT